MPAALAVLVFVNTKLLPLWHWLALLMLKLAAQVPGVVMFTLTVQTVVQPFTSVVVTDTVLAPVLPYTTLCGPCAEAVAGVAPAPKFQLKV